MKTYSIFDSLLAEPSIRAGLTAELSDQAKGALGTTSGTIYPGTHGASMKDYNDGKHAMEALLARCALKVALHQGAAYRLVEKTEMIYASIEDPNTFMGGQRFEVTMEVIGAKGHDLFSAFCNYMGNPSMSRPGSFWIGHQQYSETLTARTPLIEPCLVLIPSAVACRFLGEANSKYRGNGIPGMTYGNHQLMPGAIAASFDLMSATGMWSTSLQMCGDRITSRSCLRTEKEYWIGRPTPNPGSPMPTRVPVPRTAGIFSQQDVLNEVRIFHPKATPHNPGRANGFTFKLLGSAGGKPIIKPTKIAIADYIVDKWPSDWRERVQLNLGHGDDFLSLLSPLNPEAVQGEEEEDEEEKGDEEQEMEEESYGGDYGWMDTNNDVNHLISPVLASSTIQSPTHLSLSRFSSSSFDLGAGQQSSSSSSVQGRTPSRPFSFRNKKSVKNAKNLKGKNK